MIGEGESLSGEEEAVLRHRRRVAFVLQARWFVKNKLHPLRELCDAHPGYGLLLVGHSLGAGECGRGVCPPAIGHHFAPPMPSNTGAAHTSRCVHMPCRNRDSGGSPHQAGRQGRRGADEGDQDPRGCGGRGSERPSVRPAPRPTFSHTSSHEPLPQHLAQSTRLTKLRSLFP